MSLEMIAATVLSVLFLSSGGTKASQFKWFRDLCVALTQLPTRLASLAAICVIAAEILVGGLLLLSTARRVSAYAAVALLIVFSGIALWRLLRPAEPGATCGCHGPRFSGELSWRLLARNLAFAVLALIATGDVTRFAPEFASAAVFTLIAPFVGSLLTRGVSMSTTRARA